MTIHLKALLLSLSLVGWTTTSRANEIDFWHMFTQPERIAAIEAIAASFENDTGIKVNIEVVPWSKDTEKWTSAAAVNALPDVSICRPNVCMDMAKAEVTRDMTPLMEQMGGSSVFASEGLLEKFHILNGRMISFPFYAHARLLIYRKDVFSEVGLEPPTSWDEYVEVATKLTEPPNRYGMIQMWDATDNGATQYLWIFMQSNGGTFFDASGNAAFNTPENIEAVKQLVRLYEAGSPKGEVSIPFHGQGFDLFTSGKTMMIFETMFMAKSVKDKRPDLYEADAMGVAMPPKHKRTGWFADVIGITAMKGDNEGAADQWIMYVYDDERYLSFLHTIPGGMYPATKTASANPKFFDHPHIQKFKTGAELTLEGIAAGASIGGAHGPNLNAGILNSGIIENMMHEIVLNDKKVEDAVLEAHDKIQEQIDRSGRR